MLTSLFGRLTEPSVAALRGDVMSCFKSLHNLRSLEVGRSDRRFGRAQFVAMLARSLASTALESLTLNHEALDRNDVPLLIAIIDRLSCLTRLELASSLSAHDGPEVLLAAARHPALRVLNVDHCGVGIDAGVRQLLKQSSTLEELSLLGSDVDQEPARDAVRGVPFDALEPFGEGRRRRRQGGVVRGGAGHDVLAKLRNRGHFGC